MNMCCVLSQCIVEEIFMHDEWIFKFEILIDNKLYVFISSATNKVTLILFYFLIET